MTEFKPTTKNTPLTDVSVSETELRHMVEADEQARVDFQKGHFEELSKDTIRFYVQNVTGRRKA